jgi:hypothetical protein
LSLLLLLVVYVFTCCLRPIFSAQIEEIHSLRLSVLKVLLPKDDFNRFSRAGLLAWLNEYMVFVAR